MSPRTRRNCATSSKRRACTCCRSHQGSDRRAVAAPAAIPAINTREFLVFNQELATLLKAGMPLVQSLDLLKRRVTSPVFRTVLDDVHEKVRSGTALSDAFGAQGDLFPARLHRVAPRRRAQRQP